MTDPAKKPADIREQAGDDDELFKQLMHNYGYIVHPTHPDRARRRALRIRPGYLLPPEDSQPTDTGD